MLIIEITKIEVTGGHIEIMLIIEIAKIELTGGHIGFMLIIEIAKIEFVGLCNKIVWGEPQERAYAALKKAVISKPFTGAP